MVEVEAIVATSHPIPAYGGVQLGENVLQEMAGALRSGRLPMLAQHDLRRAINAVVLDARVRHRSDGYKELRARFRVDGEQWAKFEQERLAAGAPGGFSFSCSEPFAALQPLNGAPPEPGVALAADASHWSDADPLAAAEELRRIGGVEVGRRHEFAHDPNAVVVLELTASLITGVLGNAIFEALKRFLRRDKPTTFHFHVEEGGRTVDGRIETDDADALRRAIASFDQLVNPPMLYLWDDEEGQWNPM